jgi:hypothetical protein
MCGNFCTSCVLILSVPSYLSFNSLHFSFFYYPSLLHLFTPFSLLWFTSIPCLSHSWVPFRGIRAERNRLPRPRECCARGESRLCPDTVSNFVPVNLHRTWHWEVLLSELCRAECASSLNFSSYLPDNYFLTFKICRDTRKKSNAASVLCGAEGYLVINPSTGHVFRSETCLITFLRIPHHCQCT